MVSIRYGISARESMDLQGGLTIFSIEGSIFLRKKIVFANILNLQLTNGGKNHENCTK